MSQEEVLAVMRQSDVPLTCTEISNIGWPNGGLSRINATRDSLYKLESWGYIRRVGVKISERGNPNILWEAVE